jgi:hypothetical protein
MIVSTGMGTLDEVAEAVETIRSAGNDDITVLHCVSNYPAPPESVNLRAMESMRAALGVPIGYSDHTMGIEASVIAVAAGAKVIEKHSSCRSPARQRFETTQRSRTRRRQDRPPQCRGADFDLCGHHDHGGDARPASSWHRHPTREIP